MNNNGNNDFRSTYVPSDDNGNTNNSDISPTRQKKYVSNLEIIKAWVKENKGDPQKSFGRILIVNNGLSALRLIQGIRSLSYKISQGKDAGIIQIVALASEADWVGENAEDVNKRPEYLKQYGIEIVKMKGKRPAETYQAQDKIISIAKKMRCDAIAVGWGHLAENVEFVSRVESENFIFIGPPAMAMKVMGDKIMSKMLLQCLDLPMLPWSGSPEYLEGNGEMTKKYQIIEKSLKECQGKIELLSDAIFPLAYEIAGIRTPKKAREVAQKIGYPVVIKATAGGGGRGIRFVHREEDIENAYNSARSESRLAFTNDVVFIEKATVGNVRHIEEQILGDQHGNVVTLGERECSIQRHNQKLIEEAGLGIPITNKARERIQMAAVKAARGVSYTNAGTVEFLVEENGTPYFMEMNTRLQVEHITTEALYKGLDLVTEQLKIAMGIAIDEKQLCPNKTIKGEGHGISVRILAENPHTGFSPQTGLLKGVITPSLGPHTPRFYLGMSGGSFIHTFADSQIGHAVAWGETREQARINMISFLEGTRFKGIVTTRPFLLEVLRDDEYIQGTGINNTWLQKKIDEKQFYNNEEFNREELGLAAQGIIEYIKMKGEWERELLNAVKTGQIIRPSILVNTILSMVKYREEIYAVKVRESGPEMYNVKLDGTTMNIKLWPNILTGGYLLAWKDRIFHIFHRRDTIETYVEIGGKTIVFTNELDPDTYRAPLPGTVNEIMVEEGDIVRQGEPLVTIEAMKMINSLPSPRQGRIDEILVEVGDNVDAETILMKFSMDDGNGIDEQGAGARGNKKNSDPNNDDPNNENPNNENPNNENPNNGQVKNINKKRLRFEPGSADIWKSLLKKEIKEETFGDQPANKTMGDLQIYLNSCLSGYYFSSQLAVRAVEEALLLKTKIGKQEWVRFTGEMLQTFYNDEKYFKKGIKLAKGLEVAANRIDKKELYQLARSHAALTTKNKILSEILAELPDCPYSSLKPILEKIVELGYNEKYRVVVARCEDALRLLSLQESPIIDLDEMMGELLETEITGNLERKRELIESAMGAPESLMGALVDYLLTGKKGLKNLAGKIIILRAYRAHKDIVCTYEKTESGLRTYIWKHQLKESRKRVGVVSLVHPGESIEGAMKRLLDRLVEMNEQYPDEFALEDGIIELLISRPEGVGSGDQLRDYLGTLLNDFMGTTLLHRITFVVMEKGENYPGLMTFRYREEQVQYVEDPLYRNLHPSLGDILSLAQLSQFQEHISKLPSSDMNVHLYHYLKKNERGPDYPDVENQIFVRTMIRDSTIVSDENGTRFPAAVDAFKASLHQLRLAYAATGAHSHGNQIYLRFIRPITFSRDDTKNIIIKMQQHLSDYADVDLTRTIIHGEVQSWKERGGIEEMFIAVENPTGAMLEVKPYVVMKHDFTDNGGSPEKVLVPYELWERPETDRKFKPIDHKKMNDFHLTRGELNRKRQNRRTRGKLYAYDRMAILERKVREAWFGTGLEIPDKIFHAQELELKQGALKPELVPIDQQKGRSKLSILAWSVRVKFPETAGGRELIVISGDMTQKGGSVAVREDLKYTAAAQMACERGIPFVYFAEGSGARIGLDKNVSHRLRYDEKTNQLYLTEKDFRLLKPLIKGKPWKEMQTDKENMGTEKRFIVTSVIGGVPGIHIDEKRGELYVDDDVYRDFKPALKVRPRKTGEREEAKKDTAPPQWVIKSIENNVPEINQENLSGSGMTARASALAYLSVPTMAIVTDTCTGIISYNVRLLKRVVQVAQSEIILTGYRALNALYGGEKVFTSNRELGGPNIMGPNGVSHWITKDEPQACEYMLEWLRTVPTRTPLGPPKHPNIDPLTRNVGEDILGEGGIIQTPGDGTERPKPYNVMELARILFDRDSVKEALAHWGSTVRTGRARIGGLPVGFICVETDTAMRSIPADPAEPESRERNVAQYGQVWYPDSSFKTAEWIQFIKNERKPLVILPNWRGFAGGKLELFNEILKFGAMIVENLATFDMPVVLYVPPYAEIRGGAWVVIDAQINPNHIVFLADEHATGSIIEPSGMSTVPLVEREIFKDMRQNDAILIELYMKRKEKTGLRSHIKDIDGKIEEREKLIYPKYSKKWNQIFRLHNTAERMKEVGSAHKIVKTGRAREEIYRAIRKKLDEMNLY